MKTFIAKSEVIKTSKMYGYSTVKLTIYRIKNNIPEYIASVEYNTGSTPWEESEVFQELIRKGFIPKKAMQESVTSWRGAGYYMNDSKYCKIIIL